MPLKVVLRAASVFAATMALAQLALMGLGGLAADDVPGGAFTLTAILTCVIALPVICFSVLTAERSRVTIEHLRSLAQTDALTGILNRIGFQAAIAQVQARLATGESAGALLYLDADHFKAINDRFGHETGDHALSIIGTILTTHTRESDICGRLGGEEFAVLLKRANLEQGRLVAERIRAAVAEKAPALGHPDLHLTISIGLVVHQAGQPIDACIREADRRLYEAKASGRNRIAHDLTLVRNG